MPKSGTPVTQDFRIGKKEALAIEEVAEGLGLGKTQHAVRMAVTLCYATYRAEERGFKLQMVDGYGRRWEYSLFQPKKIFRLNKNGRRTGEEMNLVDDQPTTTRPSSSSRKKPSFESIEGGKK